MQLEDTMVESLVCEAIKARENAYAPYSGFEVGAALLTDSGRIFVGCNVENASFGATICAERNAIFAAIASGERRFHALAVVADCDEFCSPCGICRQVMAEFAPDMPVYMGRTDGSYKVMSVRELLPVSFMCAQGGKFGGQ